MARLDIAQLTTRTARLIRQRATLEKHWLPELKQWFKDSLDTPGLVLIRVQASRIKYWQDADEGEVHLPR